MESIVKYKNGNYIVTFDTRNGTKIRETDEDRFIPSFAENCDVKITDKCDGACPFCYEGCTSNGKHGDILNYKFLDTLHPYTELAINGNDLSHPDLIPFIYKMKEKKIILNMTVNQMHFERHFDTIKDWIDKKLIYGLGVSLRQPTDKFISLVKQIPTAVVHVINGVVTMSDFNALAGNGLKILILGYKNIKRGEIYEQKQHKQIVHNQNWLKMNLIDYMSKFNVISFDNLCLSQLQINKFSIKYLLNPSIEEWKNIPGYDGKYQISNFGRVKSLKMSNKYGSCNREKILLPTRINNKGYLSVNLVNKDKNKRFLVHRLVAEAFIKNDDIDKKFVNHIDEIVINNYVENLEWCTMQYNLNYGTHNEHMRKTLQNKVCQMSKDGKIIKIWDNVNIVAEKFGCCADTIRNLCKHNFHKYYHNRLKELLKYNWEYATDDILINHGILIDKCSDWEEFYMGDDGNYTFYIDMVDGTFGKNSLVTTTERYPVMDSIDEMFQNILNKG